MKPSEPVCMSLSLQLWPAAPGDQLGYDCCKIDIKSVCTVILLCWSLKKKVDRVVIYIHICPGREIRSRLWEPRRDSVRCYSVTMKLERELHLFEIQSGLPAALEHPWMKLRGIPKEAKSWEKSLLMSFPYQMSLRGRDRFLADGSPNRRKSTLISPARENVNEVRACPLRLSW